MAFVSFSSGIGLRSRERSTLAEEKGCKEAFPASLRLTLTTWRLIGYSGKLLVFAPSPDYHKPLTNAAGNFPSYCPGPT